MVVLLTLFAALTSSFLLVQRWVSPAHSSLPSQVVQQRSINSGCIYYIGLGGGYMPLVYLVSPASPFISI